MRIYRDLYLQGNFMPIVKDSSIYRTIIKYHSYLEKFSAKLAGKRQNLEQKRRQTETGLAQEEVEAFNSWAQDFFQDEGIKTYGGASDNYKNFASYMFKTIRQFLPKTLSKKVKEEYGLDLPPETLNLNKGAYRDIILIDLFEYLKENPEVIQKSMVKAHLSELSRIDKRSGSPAKETEEEESRRKYDISETGFAESFFAPKADEMTLKKLDEEGNDISDLDPGAVDKYAVEILKEHEGKNIKWKFLGFDESRIKFSLPDLFGKREFVVRMPFDVKQIRDPKAREDIKDAFKEGMYTFRVRRVGKKGAVLEFLEQAKLIEDRIAPEVKRIGLGKEEINKFFNIIAKNYIDSIQSMPIEEIGEKFGKGLELRPGLVSGAGNLGELVEMGDKGELEKSREKSRGLEQTVRTKEKAEEEEFEKGRAHEQALSDLEGLQKLLAIETTPSVLRDITELIVDRLPSNIQPRGNKYGLPSFFLSKPVSSYILNNIVFDKSTPVSGRSKDQPWFRLVTNWLYEKAHATPEVRKMASDYIRAAEKGGSRGNSKMKIEDQGIPNEQEIQKAIKEKMAASLDFEGLNKILRGEPTQPTSPIPPTSTGVQKNKTLAEKAKELKGEGVNDSPKEQPPETDKEPLRPEEIRKYFNQIPEGTIKKALRVYVKELNKIIEEHLSDHPLVNKAKSRRSSFLSYLKPDLERYVAEILNKDLAKSEEVGELTDEQAEQWDKNQDAAEDIVKLYIKNPADVKNHPLEEKYNLYDKIRARALKRYNRMRRQANLQANRYRHIIAFAHKKMKKDS